MLFFVRFPLSLKGVSSLEGAQFPLSKAHQTTGQVGHGRVMSLTCPLEGEKAAKGNMNFVAIKGE